MEAQVQRGDAAMMPPTTTIDLIRTINREFDREYVRQERIRQAMGGDARPARSEERRSILSRLFTRARFRQQEA